ncbi:MAG TPA: hypothetical protein VF439_00955 [Candidatus Paceibacterota bacterium]
MRRIAFLSPFIGISLLIAPLAAGAQTLGADPLTLDASPAYPHPYETVTITPSSSILNLSASTLTYTVNGKAAGKVSGGSSFTVQMDAAGAATTIGVTITGPDGTTQSSLVLRPSDVELIAEPQTTTHPLYPGAALVASQSTVRLVALADLRGASGRLDPKSLIYDWKLGDQELAAQSGAGQSVLMVTAPMRYRDADVSVTVSDAADTVVGSASVALAPVDPSVRIYENDPLLGPRFDTALSGTFTMDDTEASFLAVPYFFSKAPGIAWSISGTPSGQGPVVTVKSSGSGRGSASIAAAATGASALETAAANLIISFTGTQPSGGFGSLFGL